MTQKRDRQRAKKDGKEKGILLGDCRMGGILRQGTDNPKQNLQVSREGKSMVKRDSKENIGIVTRGCAEERIVWGEWFFVRWKKS